MKKRVVLLILIDGFRHDYVNAVDSPFLQSLCELNIEGTVRETFAFELRPAFFAGLQPEECDVANMYCYNPDGSPFRSIDTAHGDRERIKKDLRSEASKRGYTLVRHVGGPAEIPLELLKYFDFSEKYHTAEPSALPGHKTLFDYLRGDDRKWLWIGYPDGPGTTRGVMQEFRKSLSTDCDFVYLHFSELDWVGHKSGPHSEEQKKTMKEIDEAIREVYGRLNQAFTDVRAVIFGDHGQVEIKKNIDIEGMLKETGLALEKDYIYFLDSTQARFWFFSDAARRKVVELLGSVPEGRMLTDEDRERLRFRFPHNKFGDLIFVVDDGVGIFPNFFQHEKPCKGLHGYLPEVESNWAKLIITGCGKTAHLASPVEMVDVFPTLLELLGLERPAGMKPRSVLETAGAKLEEEKFQASVVMPTYNRLETLKKSLRAVEAQTCSKDSFELVVVDDGSSDGTGEFLEGYAKGTELNFKYFTQKNSGPASARNRAIRNSSGGVIILVGDDMIMEPDFIERHIESHREHPQAAHGFLGFIDWPKDIEITPLMEYITKEGAQQFAYEYLEMKEDLENVGYKFFWSSNISFKRLFALTHGLFNDRVFAHAMWEDIELGYRLEKAGFTLHYRKDIKVCHDHVIEFGGFAERQRMVGWYSHDLKALGVPTGYSLSGHKKERIYSKGALKDIVDAIRAYEGESPDRELLKKLYGASLHYAAMVGHEERLGNVKEAAGGIVALLYNLSLADELIAEKSRQLQEKNRKLEEKDRKLEEKDRKLGELKAKEKRLEALLNSASWKITAPLRKAGSFVKKEKK